MRKLLLVGLILVLAPGVAYAGGGGVDTSRCAGYSEGTSLEMRDSCFAGTAHFAPSDMTITIRNEGGLPHTLTAVDGSFDTGQVRPGGSAELTFAEVGVYRVFCTLHGTAAGEGMAGLVVVGEPGPETVAASLDTTVLSKAVAKENQALLAAIEAQGSRIHGLTAEQAKLLAALDGAVDEPGQTSPHVVAVTVPSETASLILGLFVGLAAGLAIATLVTVLWLKGRETDSASLELPQ